jgi:hypothetical protein
MPAAMNCVAAKTKSSEERARTPFAPTHWKRPFERGRRRAFGLLLPLAITSCIEHLGEERSSLGNLERDCTLPLPAGVSELSVPAALEYASETLFIWPTITLTDGSVVRNAAARARDATALCEVGPELLRDEHGAPRSLLPLSEPEISENTDREDGRHLELVPVGGFVHAGIGYLYYEPTWFGPGVFDAEKLGTGLCVLDADDNCQRAEVDGQTLLFPATARPLNQGGLVAAEHAFLYGCMHAASFSDPCTLTSVPLADVTDPAAYRNYNEFKGWIADPSDATILFDRPGSLTVSHFEGRYAAIVLDIFSSEFGIQFAPSPTGPFAPAERLFQAVRPDGPFPGGGKEHSGLRRDAHTLHMTYFTDRAGGEYGLHLASFRLFGRAR